MRGRAVALLLAFALVPAVSCSDGGDGDAALDAGSTTTTTTATTSTSAPGATRQAEVELLDPGREPRAAVRIAPAVGTEQRLTLRQRQHLEITAQGETQTVDVPATEIDLTYRVLSAAPDRIVAQVTYESPRIVEDEQSDPATVAQLREMLASFDGATAELVFDGRGSVLSFAPPEVRVSGPAGPFVEQLLTGLGDQVAALSMPFPEEPVGVGARWRVTSGGTIAGLRMEILSDLRLTELTGDSAAAQLDQTFTLVPGPTTIGGAPAEVEGGTLTATGTVRWPLDAVVPVLSETIEGTTAISVAQGGRRVRVEQLQRQTIEIFER